MSPRNHDVPNNHPAYRLLSADLIPAVEVTFTVDGITLDRLDLHQVTGVLEAWLPRKQAAVVRVKDVRWNERDAWVVPVPGPIVAQAMASGVYDEFVEWRVSRQRVVGVNIHIEWDPRGLGDLDELKEMYR